MAKFEWQTEDEYEWADDGAPSPSPQPRGRWRRLSTLLFLCAVLLVVGVIYRQLQQTVRDAEAEAEAAVATAVGLYHQTAAAGDSDIFRTLLSGSEPEWAATMLAQADSAQLLDRSAFGLQLVSAEPTQTDIVLSPEMNSAEITATLAYAIDIGNGLTQTVLLDQPGKLRRGQTAWLRTPFGEEAWGNQHVRDLPFGTATFRERDRALIELLLADINLTYQQICAEDIPFCRRGALSIQFDPTYTFEASQPLSVLMGQPDLRLPSPTLLGLPQDKTAYQAMQTGYTRIVMRSLLARSLTETATIELSTVAARWLYFDTLIDHMLVEQGLLPASITPAQYATAYYDANLTFVERTFVMLKPYTVAEHTAAFVLVDYWHRRSGAISHLSMLKSLATTRSDRDWLIASSGGTVTSAEISDVIISKLFFDYTLFLESKLPNDAKLIPHRTLTDV